MILLIRLKTICLARICLMDSKDFKKIIGDKLKNAYKKALSVYSYKQRQSRPRVKKDILRNED